MRDYTDMVHMKPAELVAHALDCTKVGVLSIALVEALAIQLKTQAALADTIENITLDVDYWKDRATQWQEDYNALQRQMDRTYG